ncbi:MAG: ferrochelatase [Idiomarina sp.]|nr:ferrochelatase [Idiomarina sp.]
MKYLGRSDFKHGERGKVGVLMLNLGTPDAPTPKALRKYLGQFLADPRVVEFPRVLWRIILHGIILRIRPARSAKAYATVWTDEGSPLLIHTKAQADGVRAALKERWGDDIEVAFGMRYGSPSVASGIEELVQKGVRKLLVLPLYPQYSGSTSASTFDAVAADFQQRRWLPDLRFISHYPDYAPYIDALVKSIQRFQAEHGTPDKLVFSYHGVPKRYLLQGDPYHCECYKTTRLVAERLGLSKDQYMTTFQSRFGREEWLQPYTDETLKAMPGQGIKSIQVVCPGFSSDCLETIEEIGEENRDYFLESGGEKFDYIPCLNAEPEHIAVLTQLVEENLQGWTAQSAADAQESARQAEALSTQK